jgi:hypothetical protein
MNIGAQWEFDAVMAALRTGYFAVSLDEIDSYPPMPHITADEDLLSVSFSPTCPQTNPIWMLQRCEPVVQTVESQSAGAPAADSDAGDSPLLIPASMVQVSQISPEKVTRGAPLVNDLRPEDPLPAQPIIHVHRGSIPIQPITSGLLSEALRGNAHGGDSDSEAGQSVASRATDRRGRDSLVDRSGGSGGRTGGSERSSAAGDVLKVTIYLPSKQAVRLRIPAAATVADLISEILRHARTNGISPPLTGDARCYEVRLHDEDGEPDEEIPALDKTRKIVNFGQGGVHEYCLRGIPAALAAFEPRPRAAEPPHPPVLTGPGKPGDHSPSGMYSSPYRSGIGATMIPPVELSPHLPTLRVVVPGHPTPTVCMAPIREGARIQDIIEYVARRHRLPVFHDKYVVKVSPVDQLRLNLPSREVPPHLQVASLGLDSVELSKKTFADSPSDKTSLASPGGRRSLFKDASEAPPRYPRPAAGGYDAHVRNEYDATDLTAGGGTPYGAIAALSLVAGIASSVPTTNTSMLAKPLVTPSFGPGGIMHNAITAAQFQEWHVIKVNKRGRRQERLMGIDLTRITNRKVEKKRFVSDKTVNAERLISEIQQVEIAHDSNTFTVTFKESSGEDVSLTYETQTPQEREEIISKLAFILKMNGDQQKLVRAG